MKSSAPIPPPADGVFEDGIQHPDLWLWDSWISRDEPAIDLFCLALSKKDALGNRIAPSDRNDHTFHVRHFRSEDDGQIWRDLGCCATHNQMGDGSDARNIWSGSATQIPEIGWVFLYTGIAEVSQDRPFLQSLNGSVGNRAERHHSTGTAAFLCPNRDYDQLREKGYYLGPRSSLGSRDGEESGPILAFRDPFLLPIDDELHVLFSAKIGPRVPAIGHARIEISKGSVSVAELYSPIELPDAADFTQAEVPKLLQDPHTGKYVLLISYCDRVSESDPDLHVSKGLKLYVGDHLSGPWELYIGAKKGVLDTGFGFGSSIHSVDFEEKYISLISPISEKAEPDRLLTIGPVTRIRL